MSFCDFFPDDPSCAKPAPVAPGPQPAPEDKIVIAENPDDVEDDMDDEGHDEDDHEWFSAGSPYGHYLQAQALKAVNSYCPFTAQVAFLLLAIG